MEDKNIKYGVNYSALVFVLFIGIAVIAATILLPGMFFNELPINFNTGVAYACFLELCVILYALLPCFEGFRARVAMTAYAGIFIPVLLYLMGGIVTIYLVLNDNALFTTLAVVETIIFAFIAGAIILIGRNRLGEIRSEANERQQAYYPALALRPIRDTFTSCNTLSKTTLNPAADLLRKLEERASSATRFGRPGAESIETQIKSDIETLASKVDTLNELTDTTAAEQALEKIKTDVHSLLKKFDFRERSLVR